MDIAISKTFCLGQSSNRTRGNNYQRGEFSMSRRLLLFAGSCALTLGMAAASYAQDTPTTTVTTTQTQAVQNPDGSWTVIQYPTGKEVIVDFAPGTTFTSAHGRAHIIRRADGT